MPSIYLKQTGGSYSSGSVTVNVTPDEYKTSKLFKRFKHTYPSSIPGNIFIFNEKQSNWSINPSNCLTITTESTHKDAKLTEAQVYVNKYDEKNNPLVLVLKFENGRHEKVDNKYYKLFRIQRELGRSKKISDLDKYDEKNFLKVLLRYNDVILKSITYQIDQQTIYNQKNIKISINNKFEKDRSNGFYKYTHTPLNRKAKKSYILYNGNLLAKKENKEIEQIQGKKVRVNMNTVYLIGIKKDWEE